MYIQHSNFNRGIVSTIILALIALSLVTGSVYFYISTSKSQQNTDALLSDAEKFRRNAPQLTKEELIAKLSESQRSLLTETQKLDVLRAGYARQNDDHQASVAFLKKEFASIQNHLLKDIDALFTNPTSPKPQIKVPSLAAGDRAILNSQRALITEILRDWDARIQAINPATITPEQMDALEALAEKNIKIIENFVDDLSSNLEIAIPGPGITQNQIDTYQNVVATFEQVVQSSSEIILPPVVVVTVGDPNATSSSTPPVITQVQINEQIQVVAETENQITVIENQITVNEQAASQASTTSSGNETTSGTTDTGTTNTTTTESNTNNNTTVAPPTSVNTTQNGSQTTSGGGTSYTALPDDDNALPPGSPKLIEGTNGF